jgi:ankyrin repeat protein
MRYIKLYEDFQLGDLNVMSPEEIQKLFKQECWKKNPDINLIRVIVENGLVDVNVKDRYDLLPLHLAAEKNNVGLAELLISAGADVNIKDYDGRLPLHWAAYRDNIALAKLLISAGADVDSKDNGGKSPFAYAYSEEMKALLKKHGAL